MNIFKLFGEISINNDKANKAIDDTTGHAHSASGALAKVGSTAVKAGSFLIKGLAVGAAAAGTALVALTKQAVSYYSDYEQLTGGVETLFKDSGAKVMQYATEAYKTAGLSANDYMDTVTSFSASLIKSLKDDTGKAADYANMALVDMSDNANKMGTDMASIQNAYQGFAKQNYTMLDNLKLGYGGTQQEMRRLLSDAQKIQRANGKFVNYSINSFADIVEAIHVVQGEMGITGTTAEEAATTIQGSIGMMKAAWVNFLTGMADSKQDFKTLTTNLVNSVITVANNVVPRLIETVPRLVEGIAAIGQQLTNYLPEMVASLLPSVISGVVTLVSGLVTQIPALLSAIGTAISTAWESTVWPMIQNLFKAVFGVELPDWNNLRTSISSGWKNKVWPNIKNFFNQHFNIDLPDWETLKTDATKALSDISDSIGSYLTEAINGLKEAFTTVTTAISNFFKWITSTDGSAQAFKTTIIAIAAAFITFKAAMGVKEVIEGVTNTIGLAKAGFAAFNAVLSANPIAVVVSLIAGLVAALVYLYNSNETVRNAIDTAWNAIKSVFDAVIGFIKGIIDGLIALWESWKPVIQPVWDEVIKPAFDTVIGAIAGFVQGLIDLWGKWSPAISDAWETIKGAFDTVIGVIKGFVQGLIDLWENWVPSVKTLIAKLVSDFTTGSKIMGDTAHDLVTDPVGTLQTAGSVSSETFRKSFASMFSGGSQGSGGSVGQGFAKGGVFSKPTFFDTRLGRLEVGEAGAEAVAPIDVLKGYVREAVREANNSSEGRNTDAALRELVENLPDMMVNAFAAVKVDVNNREFARLVKAVN